MQSDATERHTIAILVDNEAGVLARVVGLFSGRGYNIESLTVAEVDHAAHTSRITVVTSGTPEVIEQIQAQLGRIVPVHRVVNWTLEKPGIEREMALVRVAGSGEKRVEALRMADAFRARPVDTTHTSFVFEITGATSKIDSFIGTLATGSLFAAAISLVSNDQTISGNALNGSFGNIATTSVGGIELPVILMLVVALALWFVQKYTVVGRRIYAIGFNERGAALAGVRTNRLKFATLIVSGFVAGIAGVLLASSVSSGSPGIGPPYLLNAFAAAFLGATQFGGRFNAWGTVLSVILLGTGTTGLVLVGAHPWAQSMFSGAVLLAALGASSFERAIRARSWIRARGGRRPAAATEGGAGASTPSDTTGQPSA